MNINSEEEINVEQDFKSKFTSKNLKKGVYIFLLISTLSLTGIFFYDGVGPALKAIKNIKIPFLLLAIVLSALDMLLGGWRNHIFARVIQPDISQWVCFKANLANVFLGAVTPSQTGGGLAQLFIFNRYNIKLIDGLSISFINWISTLVFFPIAACTSLFILKGRFSEGLILYLVQYSFVIYLILLVVVAITLWKPIIIGRLVNIIGQQLSKVSSKWGNKIILVSNTIVDTIQRYQNSCKKLLQDNMQLIPQSFIITVILYLNKFTLAYVLVLGLGLEGDLWSIIAIQAVITFILYFAPSPGGSGIAELSIAALMAGIISSEYIPLFTLLSRSFLVFIPAAVGAIAVVRELKKEI